MNRLGVMTRRMMLTGTAAALAAPARAGSPMPRLAALDWSLAGIALALGVPPVGVAEQGLYRAWVGEPALPAATVELGLRLTPSLESLALLRPDLILVNPLNAALRERLARIAPLFVDDTFDAAHAPLRRSAAMTRALATRLGRTLEAETLLAASAARLAAARTRLARLDRTRPLVPVTLVDARHLTLYGAGSLFGDVLAALDLPSGVTAATGLWGTALQSLDQFGAGPPVHVLVLDPVPPAAAVALQPGGLLAAVVAARGGLITRLPPAWPFGGVLAGSRFAEQLAAALTPA